MLSGTVPALKSVKAGADKLPAGRFHIECTERPSIPLQPRIHLENDVILIELGVDRRNLPLSESIVERIVHCLHGDAQASGSVAMDRQHRLLAADLLVTGDVAQGCMAAQGSQEPGSPDDELIQVGVLQRDLILGTAGSGIDIELLRSLHEQPDANHG